MRKALGDMVWAHSRAGKAQAGEGEMCPSITCPIEHGQHDGGDPGCVTVAHVEIFHELLEVDTDGFREGVGEAGDYKAAKEHNPSPATIWGFHRSRELPFLCVTSPHRLAWEGKGRPRGGGTMERKTEKSPGAARREKQSRQIFTASFFSICQL